MCFISLNLIFGKKRKNKLPGIVCSLIFVRSTRFREPLVVAALLRYFCSYLGAEGEIEKKWLVQSRQGD